MISRLPLLAHNRHGAMAVLSPLCDQEQTLASCLPGRVLGLQPSTGFTCTALKKVKLPNSVDTQSRD